MFELYERRFFSLEAVNIQKLYGADHAHMQILCPTLWDRFTAMAKHDNIRGIAVVSNMFLFSGGRRDLNAVMSLGWEFEPSDPARLDGPMTLCPRKSVLDPPLFGKGKEVSSLPCLHVRGDGASLC